MSGVFCGLHSRGNIGKYNGFAALCIMTNGAYEARGDYIGQGRPNSWRKNYVESLAAGSIRQLQNNV
jgi:hypothetical protein